MKKVVLDTCALLWLSLQPDKLSKNAEMVINDTTIVKIISSVSFWEIAIKVKKGKLDRKINSNELLQQTEKIDQTIIIPIDASLWIMNVELPWNNQDPADRTIVALAKMHAAPIITYDKAISSFYEKIIW